ncbi:TPA: hypothetical protein H6U70_001899 [Escherichia coli]|nr:hypothetical protein [Escherichia coli]
MRLPRVDNAQADGLAEQDDPLSAAGANKGVRRGQPRSTWWAYFAHLARVTAAFSARMQVGIHRYSTAIYLRLLRNRRAIGRVAL